MKPNPACPQCSGVGVMMGVLGMLRWFRCRNCGFEFSRKIRKRTIKARKA
jgi:tRNA(Ile2) C34 agmatinyltransferase TiaS